MITQRVIVEVRESVRKSQFLVAVDVETNIDGGTMCSTCSMEVWDVYGTKVSDAVLSSNLKNKIRDYAVQEIRRCHIVIYD